MFVGGCWAVGGTFGEGGTPGLGAGGGCCVLGPVLFCVMLMVGGCGQAGAKTPPSPMRQEGNPGITNLLPGIGGQLLLSIPPKDMTHRGKLAK